MPKSRKTCCIKGCSNTPSNTKKKNPRISFYSFPPETVNAPWNVEKRILWINTIQKHMQLENWQPPSRAKICSAHFVNNTKVNNRHHPSYVPTIFPNIHSKTHPKLSRKIYHGYKYKYNLRSNNIENSGVKTQEVYMTTQIPDQGLSTKINSINLKFDVECRTEVVETSEDVDPEVNMTCIVEQFEDKRNTQTQMNITTKDLAKRKSSPEILPQSNFPSVGVDMNSHEIVYDLPGSNSFGILSIRDNETLIDCAGVSFITFDFIMNLLPDIGDMDLSKSNMLLLTLMKLKTGLSYDSLHGFFRINKNSIYKILTVMIDLLYNKMKNFISWPSKRLIISTLPDLIIKYHPNARVIKEYINIIIEEPSDLDHQKIPTPYQSMNTAKFLVGSTPSGLICFVSKCYEGKMENSNITNVSGLLDKVDPNDVILCTSESSNHCNDVLNYITYLNQRIIEFDIFSRMPRNLLPYMDHIAVVVCALTNVQAFNNLTARMAL